MDTYAAAKLYTWEENGLILDAKDKKYVLRIRDLPTEEKPREKLTRYGPAVLSVSELLAIVLSVGTKKEGVLAMANRLVKEYGEKSITNETDPKKLTEALDIPLTKACQIVACFEIGRRFFKTSNGRPTVVRTAKQAYEYVRDMRDLPKEHLRGIYLDNHYRAIHDETISIGSLTSNIVHPREVFKPALEYSAVALILAHNHPSGIAKPSQADIDITNQLIEAGKILGITLLDHLIVTKKRFVSVPAKYNL